jgi:hypothetical protein
MAHEPFIVNDLDGNSLTFHGGAQDDDGHDTVAVEADQLGRGTAWVHVRHTDAAYVANGLRTAAGLPPVDRAAVLNAAAASVQGGKVPFSTEASEAALANGGTFALIAYVQLAVAEHLRDLATKEA